MLMNLKLQTPNIIGIGNIIIANIDNLHNVLFLRKAKGPSGTRSYSESKKTIIILRMISNFLILILLKISAY